MKKKFVNETTTLPTVGKFKSFWTVGEIQLKYYSLTTIKTCLVIKNIFSSFLEKYFMDFKSMDLKTKRKEN